MSNLTESVESLSQTFVALVLDQGLRPGTKRYRQAKERFIVEQFDDYFGEDTKLGNWQKLCADLGIEGPQESIKKCRKDLKGVWVNIWDLLAAVREGHKVKKWKSQKALAEYTQRTKKFYPKERAKESGPVRALLAKIL